MKCVKNKEILDKIRSVSFFSMYAEDDEIICRIAEICSKRSFKSGDNIIKEGEYGHELFILVRGEIDILKKTLQNDTYTVTSLSADISGISVGEIALIDNDQRSASVIAKSDCDCLVITRDDFVKFGNENPLAGLNMTRMIASHLSGMLRKATADVVTLFSALVEEIDVEK